MICSKCSGLVDKNNHVCINCGTKYVKKGFKIDTASICGIIVIVGLTIAALVYFRQLFYKEVEATRISCEKTWDSENKRAYDCVYEYYVDGVRYETKMMIDTYDYPVSEKKLIYYDSNNPNRNATQKSIVVFGIIVGFDLFMIICAIPKLKELFKYIPEDEKNKEKMNPQMEPQIESNTLTQYESKYDYSKIPFKLFNTVFPLECPDDEMPDEYIDRCIDVFLNTSDASFKKLLDQTRNIYLEHKKKFFSNVRLEDYEKEGLIRDDELYNDAILLEHLKPNVFFPEYSENGIIKFYIEIYTSWDHWDHEECTIIWYFRDNDVYASNP